MTPKQPLITEQEQLFYDDLLTSPHDPTPWYTLHDYLLDISDPRVDFAKLQLIWRGILHDESRIGVENRAQQLLTVGYYPTVPVFTNSIGMPLALIPAGTFMMGSPAEEINRYADEDPLHKVILTRPFFLGVHHVTQAQYQQVMGNNPSHFSAQGQGANLSLPPPHTDDFPVDSVSWLDAVEFCKRLSLQPKDKKAGRTYRLPTEAEWEYSCRGGPPTSSSPFHFGPSLSSTQANFNGNLPYGEATRGTYLNRPTHIGSYLPNLFGLYDMHGNVWEWCQDWYGADYYAHSPRQDPPGPSEGSFRVFRGGGWSGSGQDCRSADRYRNVPGYRFSYLGFRVALSC